MADVKALAITMVVLRLICLLALAASIAVLTTDQFTNIQGVTTTFKDIVAYRFMRLSIILSHDFDSVTLHVGILRLMDDRTRPSILSFFSYYELIYLKFTDMSFRRP